MRQKVVDVTGNDGVSILCTGDIHLGRHPSRVEPEADELSPTHVWERMVQHAIVQGVDVVALTGDVVDQDNRYYEARGPLERGIRRLAEEDIQTVAVAGNHDWDVLPDLVRDIGDEDFHLLGGDGTWEHFVVEQEGQPAVQFVGWSYPSRHVHSSPLEDLAVPDAADVTVGLLHTELDQPDSDYAPVRSADLGRQGVNVWLLGHIHQPHQPDCDVDLALYPGSPQPLDPGEQGIRGPWLVNVGGPADVSCHQIPLATLCYRQVVVDLEDADDESEFRRRSVDAVKRDAEEVADSGADIDRVVCRLICQGRTRLHRLIDVLGEQLADELVDLTVDGMVVSVDRVIRETVPPIDLQRVAQGSDPPGVLAKLLLKLRDGRVEDMPEESQSLFDAIRDRIHKVHHSGAYQPLSTDEEPDEKWVRDQVFREGMALLDELLGSGR